MNPVSVAPGTIAFFSDLTCPFAHVAVHRIHTTRTRLGLEGRFHIDHHSFPIELLNETPGTRHGSDSEVPVLGRLEPDAGWQLWQGPDYHYPSSVLLAFEAIHAAKRQGLAASEALDRALRRAFWAESRPIHLYHEILSIARTVAAVDVKQLEEDLRAGSSRRAIFEDFATVKAGAVSVSPHAFLADGSDYANPGMTVRWQGDWAKGFPVVVADEPSVYEIIVVTAANSRTTNITEDSL